MNAQVKPIRPNEPASIDIDVGQVQKRHPKRDETALAIYCALLQGDKQTNNRRLAIESFNYANIFLDACRMTDAELKNTLSTGFK